MKWKVAVRFLSSTFNLWLDSRAPTMGAALAYYTVFSVTPLLIIVVAVASLLFGHEAATGQLAQEMRSAFGTPVADALQTLVDNNHKSGNGVLRAVTGVIILLFVASGVFAELQGSLNAIWGVEAKPNRGFLGVVRDRFLSFTMVLGTAFILLASLVLTALLSALALYWTPVSLPGGVLLWEGLNALISFAVISLLFALIYKVLPDAKIGWGAVWIGAVVTALLFTVGKHLLSVYVVYSGVTTAYGAAGSLVLILLWVYYSAQIFLFGAAFTRVYTEERFHQPVRPTANAVRIRESNDARESSGPHPVGQPL